MRKTTLRMTRYREQRAAVLRVQTPRDSWTRPLWWNRTHTCKISLFLRPSSPAAVKVCEADFKHKTIPKLLLSEDVAGAASEIG
jgi:hypothetical protein